MQFWKAQTAPLATAQFGASKSFAFESCFASKSHGGDRKSHLNRRLSSPSFNGKLLVIQRFNWEGFCMTKSLVWRSYAFMSFPMYLAGRSSACQPKLFLPGWDEILLQGGEGAHGRSQTIKRFPPSKLSPGWQNEGVSHVSGIGLRTTQSCKAKTTAGDG